MHPNKKEGVVGHAAKLKKMTAHYGAADPKMNKYASVDAEQENGPQEAQGFGVEGNAVPKRNDRASRRAMNANPVAAYKKGGRVHERHKAAKRADGGDVSSIETANRDQKMADLSQNRARGGRTKKGATHVQVIVAPQSGNQATPPPVLPPGGPMAGAMPPGMPPKPPMMAGGPPMAGLGGPGGMPPGLPLPPGAGPPGLMPPRKRGGRVEHEDAAEDASQIRKMVKPSALKRARGGLVKLGLDEGSVSGEGRLVKAAVRARRKSGDKAAAI